MYARSTTFHADKARLDDGIAYVRSEVLPAVSDMDGCIGVSLLVERKTGRSIITTAWRDELALQASDQQVAGLRARGAEAFGATAEVQVWEIAVLHRTDEAGHQACVRATWTQCDADRVQRSIDTYRETLLPAIEELPGFRSASLFVDRARGRSVSSVTYADRSALDESREAAVALRRTAVQENDLQVLEIAEFDLEIAHLRVPETV